MEIEEAWSETVKLTAEENCHLINPEKKELLCASIDVLWNKVYTPTTPEEICDILGIGKENKKSIASLLGNHAEVGYFGIERKIVKLTNSRPDLKTCYAYNPHLAEKIEKETAEMFSFDEIKKAVLENEDAFVEISNRQMYNSGQRRLFVAKQIFENGIGRYVTSMDNYEEIYETEPMKWLCRTQKKSHLVFLDF